MIRRAVVGVIALTLALTGCSGGDDPNVQACKMWKASDESFLMAAKASDGVLDALQADKDALEDAVLLATGDVRNALRLVRQGLDDPQDVQANGEARFAAVRACRSVGVEMTTS